MLSLSLKKLLTATVTLCVIITGIYFLYNHVPRYFVFTQNSYGPYFWPRATFLFIHVFFGMTAFVLGPFQFISRIRKNHVKIHRTMGKIYLCSIAVSAPAASYMAFTSQVNFVYAAGLLGLDVAWVTTSLIAYISIRKGLTSIHREWMVRSYVVTFAFATFRLFDDLLNNLGVGPENLRLALLSWACWSIPLFTTEVIFQVKKLNKLRLAVRGKTEKLQPELIGN